MQVPLLDLKAQYATIKNEIVAAISEVLESQRCIGGPKVAELEEKIAAKATAGSQWAPPAGQMRF